MSQLPYIERATPVLDFAVGGADGRTVTALACTFGEPYAVSDQWGNYDEIINSAAFGTRRMATRGVGVYYNHTLNTFGQPSDRLTMPVGTPLEIYPDARGLVTVTRYATTALGDEVLTLIKDEVLRAQSFRGPVHTASDVVRNVNGRKVIERMKLGLVEYGPTVAPANPGALILAIRNSATLADRIEHLTDEQRDHLLSLLEDPSSLAAPSSAPSSQDGPQSTTEPSPDTAAAFDAAISLLEAEAAQRRRRLS